MSSTRTSGTSTAFRTLQPGQFPSEAGISENAGASFSAPFTPAAGAGAKQRLSDLFWMTGIDLSTDESSELAFFEGFLGQHVQPSRSRDVQCMLLWNEWVRVFRRENSRFPGLIREHEFRSAVTGLFGAGITTDGWRGEIYSGIRFIP